MARRLRLSSIRPRDVAHAGCQAPLARTPIQKAAWSRKTFEYGTWGGEFRDEFVPAPGDIVVGEHWCSSGLANTDLDLQLKRHGIQRLIVIGLIAHTCIEATVRFAAELGYDVTMVKDATADYSDEMMHAALDSNMPNYASAIVTTAEVVASMVVSRHSEGGRTSTRLGTWTNIIFAFRVLVEL